MDSLLETYGLNPKSPFVKFAEHFGGRPVALVVEVAP